MYIVLLFVCILMACYLLHELRLVKLKKSFEGQIQNLIDEKVKILTEIEGLRAKDVFYSQISLQLERKNDEIVELSTKIAKLETKLNLKP